MTAAVPVRLVGCSTALRAALEGVPTVELEDWRELLGAEAGVVILGGGVRSLEVAAREIGRHAGHEMVVSVNAADVRSTRDRMMVTPFVPLGIRVVAEDDRGAVREAVQVAALRRSLAARTARAVAGASAGPRPAARRPPPADESLVAFHRVWDANRELVTQAILAAAQEDPALVAVLAAQAAEPEAQRDARERDDAARQRAALVDGDWAPLLENLHAQGAAYAAAGLPFGSWYALLPAFRRTILNSATEEDATSVKRLALGMDRFLDRAMLTIGDAYRSELEQERRRADEARERLIVALTRSNEDLEHFAYVASHDLQEPLRMVIAHLALLDRVAGDELDDAARQYMRFASDGAQRMKALVNDLLTYARVDSSGAEPRWCALDDVLDRVCEGLAQVVSEAGARVERGELPRVWADPGQLEILLTNLVGNALKFRSQEPPRVLVEAAARGPVWQVAVRDNGVGFDAEHSERMFKMFQRLHDRGQFAGTGIGLAIAKRIVERHRGRIWAESGPDGGATFRFTLHRPTDETQ